MSQPLLVLVCGLPGVGKTTLARAFCARHSALYLRIDSIEQAMRGDGVEQVGGTGYAVAHAAALDNLRLGFDVVAECVSPWTLTRDAWLDVARRANARCVEIEIVCSDAAEHQRRVEARTADIEGLTLPTWTEVLARDYRPWDRPHVVVDTAGRTPEACLHTIEAAIRQSQA